MDQTRLLHEAAGGNKDALNQLLPLVYEQFHACAEILIRGERLDHTLQATALVNEAYLKLISDQQLHFENRKHFFAFAAKIMRHILIDHAREKSSEKRELPS